jgi:hypothetical protein
MPQKNKSKLSSPKPSPTPSPQKPSLFHNLNAFLPAALNSSSAQKTDVDAAASAVTTSLILFPRPPSSSSSTLSSAVSGPDSDHTQNASSGLQTSKQKSVSSAEIVSEPDAIKEAVRMTSTSLELEENSEKMHISEQMLSSETIGVLDASEEGCSTNSVETASKSEGDGRLSVDQNPNSSLSCRAAVKNDSIEFASSEVQTHKKQNVEKSNTAEKFSTEAEVATNATPSMETMRNSSPKTSSSGSKRLPNVEHTVNKAESICNQGNLESVSGKKDHEVSRRQSVSDGISDLKSSAPEHDADDIVISSSCESEAPASVKVKIDSTKLKINAKRLVIPENGFRKVSQPVAQSPGDVVCLDEEHCSTPRLSGVITLDDDDDDDDDFASPKQYRTPSKIGREGDKGNLGGRPASQKEPTNSSAKSTAAIKLSTSQGPHKFGEGGESSTSSSSSSRDKAIVANSKSSAEKSGSSANNKDKAGTSSGTKPVSQGNGAAGSKQFQSVVSQAVAEDHAGGDKQRKQEKHIRQLENLLEVRHLVFVLFSLVSACLSMLAFRLNYHTVRITLHFY